MQLRDQLEIVHRTHPGMMRSHNEDSISVSPALGLAVLADGMGGYNAGEIASGMATVLLCSSLEADLLDGPSVIRHESRLHALLQARVGDANRAIFQSAQSRAEYAGMGTTLVMALFQENFVTIAHIGDSRMYRLRGETLTQVTRDHSLLQEHLDAGKVTADQARSSHYRNLVTRGLGVEAEVSADISGHETQLGDLYLLCSDGLTDMVADEDLRETMLAFGTDLEGMAEALVNLANAHGGRDNIAVILVSVKRRHRGSGHALGRFVNWWR